jgi:hypothetical protein
MQFMDAVAVVQSHPGPSESAHRRGYADRDRHRLLTLGAPVHEIECCDGHQTGWPPTSGIVSPKTRRNFPDVMETLTEDCFLEHVSLGLRSEEKRDATTAYASQGRPFSAPVAVDVTDTVPVVEEHGSRIVPWATCHGCGRMFTPRTTPGDPLSGMFCSFECRQRWTQRRGIVNWRVSSFGPGAVIGAAKKLPRMLRDFCRDMLGRVEK